MKLYKSLCVYFATICFIATFCILHFTFVSTDYIHLAFLSAPVSVFSVSVVGLVASFVMYKSTQQTLIILLKRRAGRVYAELLHHKMRLIDVIDGKRYVDIEKYLYHRDALRLKNFCMMNILLCSPMTHFLKTQNPTRL